MFLGIGLFLYVAAVVGMYVAFRKQTDWAVIVAVIIMVIGINIAWSEVTGMVLLRLASMLVGIVGVTLVLRWMATRGERSTSI